MPCISVPILQCNYNASSLTSRCRFKLSTRATVCQARPLHTHTLLPRLWRPKPLEGGIMLGLQHTLAERGLVYHTVKAKPQG